MKIKYAIAALLMLISHEATAQGNTTGLVVASCGNQTFKAGNPGPFTVDLTGKICINLGSGVGTVTSVSVVTANGFAGTVATATTTPAITLTTTISGILSGNGTAISAASTTGSGAVVLANTPTLITPVLGAATGTSLALGGATIGSNAISSIGQYASFGATTTGPGFYSYLTGDTVARVRIGLDANDNPSLAFGPGGATTRDTFLMRIGAGIIQHGTADVDTAPVAQTIRTQGTLAGGTSNVAGANLTFIVSPGKGTGVGGSFIVQTTPAGSTGTTVNAPATGLTVNSAQQVQLGIPGLNGSPALVASADTTTGLRMAANSIILVASGTPVVGINNSAFFNPNTASGYQVSLAAASSTSPVYIPNRTDLTTGYSSQAAGNLSLVVGGAENTRFVSTGLNVILATDASASSGSGALQVSGGASIAKRFWIPAITASSGLQTAVLCQSSGGEMIADSVACLASSARFKDIRGPLSSDIIDKFMKLPIKVWAYKEEGIFKKGNWTRDRIGPIAEDVEKLDPRLVEYDNDGQVRAYSTEQLLAYTIKVVQEQQAQIDGLRARRR